MLAAYGWEEGLSNEEILERLLALNLERSRGQGVGTQPDPADEDAE